MFVNRLVKRLRGNYPACENVEVFSDDVFLVSYPRSGNTWLRFMMGKLIYNIDMDFVNKENIIPDIYKNSNKQLKKMKRPRIIKSHEQYDERYKKVIYIYRDARDVAVSYHKWFQKYRDYNNGLDEFISEFIKGSLDNYGRWDEHVKSWIDRLENNNILMLRYEDIRNDTYTELEKILKFLNIVRNKKQIDESILSASANKMSSLEKVQENISIELKSSRKDIKFIRDGNGQGWDSMLSVSQKEKLNNAFADMLARLGY